MSALLQIHNLSVHFRQDEAAIEAVRNISFDIQCGEILAIAGESGSGKSITALSIMGLLPGNCETKGSIILNDPSAGPLQLLENKKLSEIRGSSVSMIFQEPMTSLNPLMKCGEQVSEAYKRKKRCTDGEAKKEALEALNLAGFALPNRIYDRYPHQLSGGQKQRVMIAMAIVCRPLLLIADEPTTALDVRIQKEVLGTLKDLRSLLGMSVLIISHDLGIISELADSVIILKKGEIAEQGMTEDVLRRPKHPYTAALLACRVAGHPRGTRLPVIHEEARGIKPESNFVPSAPGPKISSTELLRVEGLTVYHTGDRKGRDGIIKAVDDVSFRINRNEITGLVGESGCGKTTLGRALLGLIRPSSGRILLNGKEIISSHSTAQKSLHRELQIVFQDPYGSLNPRLTIGDAIMEVMRVHQIGRNNAERKEKTKELLEKVNLQADHLSRYPHQFSGGQRQRICIARALATNPSFIVFDESLSALDVSIQAQILNLISDLKNIFGFTALFISHDLALVNYLSDRIMVMRAGKIIEQGPADKIFSQPGEPYTRLLLDSIPGKNMTHP